MRYSSRTRPMPSGSMFTSSALRSPSACITRALVLVLDVGGHQLDRLVALAVTSWNTTRGLLTASS
jgi:hypothetical protein